MAHLLDVPGDGRLSLAAFGRQHPSSVLKRMIMQERSESKTLPRIRAAGVGCLPGGMVF